MRKIDRPSYKIRDVLEILRNEVGNFNETIGQNFDIITDSFSEYEEAYEKNYENLSDLSVDTKNIPNGVLEDIKEYYCNYYVGKPLYSIRLEMEKNVKMRCPICDCPFAYSQVTLDHILPKSKFPLYAITPINLVPTCHNCNMRKGKSVPSKVLHPYFHGFMTFEYLTISIKVNEENPCESIIEVEFADSTKENCEDIKKNIDLYKLRQKYTDLSNIVFLKLMDEYKQVINVVENVYSINGLKKSFKCLDILMDSTDYIIDENYLRHLCISAIIKDDTFLICLAKKLNIFVDYNAKIFDSINELKDKVQKRYILNQSNVLQIIKETLPLILFVGIYKS